MWHEAISFYESQLRRCYWVFTRFEEVLSSAANAVRDEREEEIAPHGIACADDCINLGPALRTSVDQDAHRVVERPTHAASPRITLDLVREVSRQARHEA